MLLPHQPDLLRSQLYPLYKDIAQPDESEPWRQGYCVEWSDMAGPMIHATLAEDDFKVVHVKYIVPADKKEAFGIERTHEYVAGLPSGQEPVLFDGTYLQFSTVPATDQYPIILMGSLPHITRTLTAAGIPEERHEIWDMNSPQIRLNEIRKDRARAAKRKLLNALFNEQLPTGD